jgi:hypothetical protein
MTFSPSYKKISEEEFTKRLIRAEEILKTARAVRRIVWLIELMENSELARAVTSQLFLRTLCTLVKNRFYPEQTEPEIFSSAIVILDATTARILSSVKTRKVN